MVNDNKLFVNIYAIKNCCWSTLSVSVDHCRWGWTSGNSWKHTCKKVFLGCQHLQTCCSYFFLAITAHFLFRTKQQTESVKLLSVMHWSLHIFQTFSRGALCDNLNLSCQPTSKIYGKCHSESIWENHLHVLITVSIIISCLQHAQECIEK